MEITSYIKEILNFCTYRERSHAEVRKKIRSLGYDELETEEIIVFLIEENFLNEARYAEVYVRGKFNYNGWGKMKIIRGLKQNDVSEPLIKKALLEIDPEDYEQLIVRLIDQKNRDYLKEKNLWNRKQKIKQFLIQRGFEFELIDEQLNFYFLNEK